MRFMLQSDSCCSVLQRVATVEQRQKTQVLQTDVGMMRCSVVLQCGPVCSCVLQCVAAFFIVRTILHK